MTNGNRRELATNGFESVTVGVEITIQNRRESVMNGTRVGKELETNGNRRVWRWC